MRRYLVPVVLGLLALPTLAACGDDPDPFDSYCATVEDEQDELARILDEASSSSGLLPGLPIFERLEDASPDDIADDWSVVVERLSTLADALEDAGVDPASYDASDPPDDVTPDQQELIAIAAGGVATEQVSEALGNVQQQARDVCKTDLAQVSAP